MVAQGLPHAWGPAGTLGCSCHKGQAPGCVSFCSNTAQNPCGHERAPARSQKDLGRPAQRAQHLPCRKYPGPVGGPAVPTPQQTPPIASLGCGPLAPLSACPFQGTRNPQSLRAGGKGGGDQTRPGTCAVHSSSLLLMRNEGTRPRGGYHAEAGVSLQGPGLPTTFFHGLAHLSGNGRAHGNRQDHVMSCHARPHP